MKLLSYAIAWIAVIGILSTGCAKKTIKSEETGQGLASQAGTEKAQTPAETQQTKPAKIEESTSKAETIGQAEAKKESAPVVEAKKGLGDVFFDFDRFTIRDDAKPILEDDAGYLKANKNLKVIIEGHCDERGTSEYNIALGERRAKAVQQYLTDLGIDTSRISTISYGKEKPFCEEHNEQCWQENRRARFVAK